VSSESKAKREARRRASKLGDLLPDTTSDESDEGWNEEGDTRDDEMRRDVPPHHGQ
jgi:hypothetical protein